MEMLTAKALGQKAIFARIVASGDWTIGMDTEFILVFRKEDMRVSLLTGNGTVTEQHMGKYNQYSVTEILFL